MEVLRRGYLIPFARVPPVSQEPIPMPSYAPMSTKGVALGEVTRALISKGAVELAPLPFPGFYSRLFVVWKTSESWRPVIDLSHLNRFLASSPFKMETIQSVLLLVRPGDWMVSIDLKEAFLQIPVHPESRKYLRFVAFGRVYHFRALCFGLASAPQVFTRVMAPVSSILHSMGIRLCRYLDDWLIQSSSREAVLHDLQVVLDLCMELGIVVNPEKSNFVPSQKVLYLGTVLDSRTLVASPSPDRIARLLSLGGEFLSSVQQPAACWRSLLGALSSLTHLVPGGGLRMRSLQFQLHRHWDQVEDSTLVSWTPACRLDLLWWLDELRLQRGVSLAQVSPDLDFWSDASDVGWGGHLGPEVVSGLWSPDEVGVSINARELLAMEKGLLHFQSSLRGSTVAIYMDNSTAVAYLRKYPVSLPQQNSSEDLEMVGASRDHPSSAVHSGQSQCPHGLSLPPSSVSGLRMDSSPRCLSGSLPSVASDGRPVCHLSKSPLFCLFLSLPGSSGSGDRCVSPVLGRASSLRLPSLVHHSPGPGEAACFSGNLSDVSGSVLAPEAMVSRAPGLGSGSSGGVTESPRPSVSAPVGSVSSRSPQASTSCLETLRRFTRAAGFSSGVASQVGLARRASSRTNYQLKWSTFRSWCRKKGHSISRPSVSKVADFLLWLHRC